MKAQNSVISRGLISTLVLVFLLTAGAGSVMAEEPSISDRMLHHRAIDAVVWAMPLLNFKTYREGHKAIGVGYNDIAYYSQIQDWKFQTATPNNTTPYVNFFWNTKDGPIVIEIPPSTKDVGIFGTLMDAWQRPLEDVGAKGRDAGRGAKYLMTPPGYNGPLLPGAYTYEQRTYNGFAILRSIIADGSAENIAKANDFAKTIRIYPLAAAGDPPANNYIDIYGKMMEGIIKLDVTVYSELNDIIQEEIVDETDLAMMGLLNTIGIRKGSPFAPDEKMQAMFAVASGEALQYMIEQYHRYLNPFVYEGKKWSTLLPRGAGVRETEFTWQFANYLNYHDRGCAYYAIISSVKNFGSATYYLDLAEDNTGSWLEGSKNYKLVVPPNVPAKDFWSVTVYDLESAAWIREMTTVGISSATEGVAVNDDGSVDIFFGPKAPSGKEPNWIPTAEGRRFFLLFRFYGPEPAVFDGSFELNDAELIK